MIDVAIIGSGPAGLSAAIYTARAGFSTVVFEELGVGGSTNFYFTSGKTIPAFQKG